jgi:hypothetical protein
MPLCELNLLRLVSPVQLCLRRTGVYTGYVLRSCPGPGWKYVPWLSLLGKILLRAEI